MTARRVGAVALGVLLGHFARSSAFACIVLPTFRGAWSLSLTSVEPGSWHPHRDDEVARWTSTATWHAASRTLVLDDGTTLVLGSR